MNLSTTQNFVKIAQSLAGIALLRRDDVYCCLIASCCQITHGAPLCQLSLRLYFAVESLVEVGQLICELWLNNPFLNMTAISNVEFLKKYNFVVIWVGAFNIRCIVPNVIKIVQFLHKNIVT